MSINIMMLCSQSHLLLPRINSAVVFHCSSAVCLFVCVFWDNFRNSLSLANNIYQCKNFGIRETERVEVEVSSRPLMSEWVINNNRMENNSVENLWLKFKNTFPRCMRLVECVCHPMILLNPHSFRPGCWSIIDNPADVSWINTFFC